MHFLELALQGVRNFQQMRRLALPKGLVVITGGTGTGKSTLIDVALHVLYPNPTEPATDRFRGADPSQCRLALLLEDHQGKRYRLVQDLLRGSIALTQLDPATGKFVPVTSSAAEILQYLTSTVHLPQRDVLEEIFVTRDGTLPTSRPASAAAPMLGAPPLARAGAGAGGMRRGGALTPARGTPAAKTRRLPPTPVYQQDTGGDDGPRFPGYQGPESSGEVLPEDPVELRRQIDVLTHDLTLAVEVDELQFKQDGLQKELFEADHHLKGLKESQEKVERLQTDLKRFAHLSAVPKDFKRRVDDFGKAREHHQRDLTRLEEEREKWLTRSQANATAPLYKNKTFLAGLGIALLAIAVGILGFYTVETLRYAALADILGFGIVLASILRSMDRGQDAERAARLLESIDERRQKLDRQFEVESALMKKLMTEADVDHPRDILTQLEERDKIQLEVDGIMKSLAARKADPAFAQAEKRRIELQAQVDDINKKLEGATGLMMGTKEMERRLVELKHQLARIESGATAAAPDFGSPAGLEGFGPPGAMPLGQPGGGWEDPAPAEAPVDASVALVSLARDLLLCDVEQLAKLLTARASQYVGALTAQAYPQLCFDPNGAVECLAAATGTNMPFAALPAAVQDLVYLGLKFTVVEIYSRRQPVPMLLDDPFLRVSPQLHGLLGKMLGGLGKATQVVLLTSQPQWTQHAATTIQL